MAVARRLAVLGVGLIGGSLARALRRAGAVGEIVGCGRNEAHLARALELGVVDRAEREPAAAVADADLVVLAVPLGAMRSVLAAAAPALAEDAVVTDVGSAKASVVADARAVFGAPPPWFVPGHPIAGTERSGVEAAFAELFEDHRVILTPLAETDPAALERVRRMWEATGAVVETMAVEHHDAILAATSHLPHMLAYALVDALARMDGHEEIFRFAAGGFRDFTRIASSDPVMWHDICLANREALLPVLRRFEEDLGRLTDAIARGDSEVILATFRRAKQARDRHVLGRREG